MITTFVLVVTFPLVYGHGTAACNAFFRVFDSTQLIRVGSFVACLSLHMLGFAADSEWEPSRPVSSNRASPASKRLNFFGSTRDVAEVDFAFPVGSFRFERAVDLIAADFSSAATFLSLCCCLHVL